jgi:hypothetical protein
MKIVALILSVGLLASCSTNTEDSNDKSQSALTLVKEVCDGDNELSWEERAELAAQANYLDKRWERLADATYSQVGSERVVELVTSGNLADYPEPALEKYYEARFQYAKFAAECSILKLIDKEDK